MEFEKGYLVEPYKVFYLFEQNSQVYDAHYHDFNKCILVCKGHLDYSIEGKNHLVHGPTVILVKEHEMHHVKVYKDQPYERVVLYLRSDFLEEQSTSETNLLTCFNEGDKIIALNEKDHEDLLVYMKQLSETISTPAYGHDVLAYSLLLAAVVKLNEIQKSYVTELTSPTVSFDKRVESAMAYIQHHLTGSLTIQEIADVTYLSKYHLMRLFKQETGYSIHQYVLEKRLVLATRLIKEGMSYSEAAQKAGFTDYSIFLRAFKKRYDLSPRQYFDI